LSTYFQKAYLSNIFPNSIFVQHFSKKAMIFFLSVF
jgi:hypothetical protein